MDVYLHLGPYAFKSSLPTPNLTGINSRGASGRVSVMNSGTNLTALANYQKGVVVMVRPVIWKRDFPGNSDAYLTDYGDPINLKCVNEGFGKVNPGKFGLKGEMNTDAIEQLINDGKRFFLTAGGQQLLNNILSGVS